MFSSYIDFDQLFYHSIMLGVAESSISGAIVGVFGAVVAITIILILVVIIMFLFMKLRKMRSVGVSLQF